MMRLRIVAVLIAFATLGSAEAHAERAFAMADVNLRTGPDVEFPSVDVIPEGEPVYIEGCLRDELWCDVSWDGGRGWVFSEYLAVEYDGQMVPLIDVGLVEFRIAYVDFVVSDYWNRYYVGRPWYRDRNRWFSYRIRPRTGWHGPPSGGRRPGWWRSGYHAPRGMRPPPDRGWRRTQRHDRGRHEAINRDQRDDGGRRGRYRTEDGRSDGEKLINRGRVRDDDRHEGRGGRADERRDPGDRGRSNRDGDRGNRNDGDSSGQDRGDAQRRGEFRGSEGRERGGEGRGRERKKGGEGREDRGGDRGGQR